ncbi:MAG: hypothetical protein FJX75_25590 [Armatimonadetes bacterium]|nr:hypothetical protein [Armatimonadota bacterium]
MLGRITAFIRKWLDLPFECDAVPALEHLRRGRIRAAQRTLLPRCGHRRDSFRYDEEDKWKVVELSELALVYAHCEGLTSTEHHLAVFQQADWHLRRARNWVDRRQPHVRVVYHCCAGQVELLRGRALALQRDARGGEFLYWHRLVPGLVAGEFRCALDAAGLAREVADEAGADLESWAILAEALGGAARVRLAAEDGDSRAVHLAQAEERVTGVLARCRRSDPAESEPDILLTSARCYRLMGNKEEARRLGGEALGAADSRECRLAQADCHNLLGQLALDDGDKEMATREAGQAYERAWCDGPGCHYYVALLEARAILRQLGVAPPPGASPFVDETIRRIG